MSTRKIGTSLLGIVTAAASTLLSGMAQADVKPYQGIPADQAEFISSPENIMSTVQSGAPTAIWQVLEHGESVECLQCIPYVSPLLYSTNAKNREIAAWWLRRRIFGVFGPGEVYSQTVQMLETGTDAVKRADAASALGEFLVSTGIKPLANALLHDSSAGVRAAAASALARIDDDGNGALAQAFGDSDETVRVAAYQAAAKINSFTDVVSASRVAGDPSPLARRAGVELLDAMDAVDAVSILMTLAQDDPDEEVRLNACHALGTIGDPSARSVLTDISTNDSSLQVQDQARIALLRI